MHIGGAADDVVGNLARNFAQHHPVFAVGAVARHHVKTFLFGNLEHARQVGRVILQITIHSGNVLALRVIDARHQRQALAVVFFQFHHPESRMRDAVQLLQGLVFGTIVYKDHFIFVSLQGLRDALYLGLDVFFFVVDTNDYR